MRTPIGAAEFVANQRVGGLIIRHPQKGLREREQRDALFGVQPVFVQEAVDPAGGMRAAHVGQQAPRASEHALPRWRL